MLDIEQTEGGFRDQLFCQVSNSRGDTYWYSPLLGRCSPHVDPMPQGGILGQWHRRSCTHADTLPGSTHDAVLHDCHNSRVNTPEKNAWNRLALHVTSFKMSWNA